jgi:exopolyphosphatase / guanosine-5'-triphosphate,3'-diphosphate pyrophosphatase
VKKSLRLASLDIGTNSTRLLVSDCDGSHSRTVDRRMVITRLGEGVDKTRRLSAAALARTQAALESYRDVMQSLQPAGVAAAATSVLRDSENGAEFLELAGSIIGVQPRVLSGEEEAVMSFLGAGSDLTPPAVSPEPGSGSPPGAPGGKVLVFDIGGGSTELVVGDADLLGEQDRGINDGALKSRSIDVGCVRMSERFLTSDPPSPLSVGRMESFIVQKIKPAMSELLPGKPALAVGLAGTVTTLSGIKQGLREYDTKRIHHSKLSRGDVEEIFIKLASVSVEERKRVMGLEPGRADIIIGGAAILRIIMDLAKLEDILVSEKDILDGLVIDLYRSLGRRV